MAERSVVSVDRSMLPPNKKEPKRESAVDIRDEEREKLASVVSNGKVIVKKPSVGSRIKALFIAEDVGDVKAWLVQDVVVPFIQDTIMDLLDLYFHGNTRRSRSSRRGSGNSFISTNYRDSYDGGRRNSRGRNSEDVSRNEKVDYRDIVLTNLEDAKEVVNQLYDRIERYDNATIADLLELCNLTSSYNQTRYGWTSKSQIGYKRVSNGYLIDVDESEYLG